MINFNNDTSRGLALQAYNTIMDMLSFENLYDNNYDNIIARINDIENMKPFMPSNIFNSFANCNSKLQQFLSL